MPWVRFSPERLFPCLPPAKHRCDGIASVAAIVLGLVLLWLEADVVTELLLRSPAKINWTLRVERKREDGFHEIASLVSPVSLFDELAFSVPSQPGISLACDASDVPTDSRNLVWRAAESLSQAAGHELAVHCRLNKRIPAGGGLGGGSSNAASTLLALNQLWELNWGVPRLAAVASAVGSDVPVFLCGGPALMKGRGEIIEPVPVDCRLHIVLVMPGLHVSTAEVYKAWQAHRVSDAGRPLIPTGETGAVEWMQQTFNTLEPPAIHVCPTLGDLQRRLEEMAARPVRISGSGSSLFTAFDTVAQAASFRDAVEQRLALRALVVQTIQPS